MKLNDVKHIGIIGNGMIGISMSVLTTGHGYKTTCLVRNEAKIPEYEAAVKKYFDQMIAHEVMPKNQFEICKKYLTYTSDLSDLADCEIIYECLPEALDLKHEMYAKIEETCPNVRAICSVTSTIVAEDLGAKMTKYKDRIIVTHPFHPAHFVPFFELCGNSSTSPEAMQFAVEVLESLDRKPVVLKKPTPGFIGNRLQFALWREAVNLVESGVCDMRDIDTCLNYSFANRYTTIGIFEHFDSGGMLLNKAGCEGTWPHLSNRTEAPELVTDRIARGDMGMKSGVGFYDWRNEDMDAYQERVSAPYWKFINWDYPTE